MYKKTIDEVMTFPEATERWKLKDSTLRKAAERNTFKDYEARKSKGVWLITREAMQNRYGEEPKE